MNEEGNIDYVNPAMLRISGDTYEQFKNLNVFRDLEGYKNIGLASKINEGFKGEYFSMEGVEYTSKFGEKRTIRNFIGIPMEEEDEKKVLMIVEDITERQKAQEDLLKTFSELKRFKDMTVGRESRMIELKREVNDLSRQLGRPEPYDLAFSE